MTTAEGANEHVQAISTHAEAVAVARICTLDDVHEQIARFVDEPSDLIELKSVDLKDISDKRDIVSNEHDTSFHRQQIWFTETQELERKRGKSANAEKSELPKTS